MTVKAVHAFTNETLSFRTRYIDGNTYVVNRISAMVVDIRPAAGAADSLKDFFGA